jgi:hypothetical protein
MNKVIAVEDNLTPFKNYLANEGYRVIGVKEAKGQNIDAVVLSGSDENLMGMQDVIINAPIINAKGRTPQQVLADILQSVMI